MGHIGYKLLPRLVERTHLFQHTVKSIGDQLCLCIVCDRNVRIHISIRDIFDGSRDLVKWFDKNTGENVAKNQHHHSDHADHQDLFLLQRADTGIDLIHGDTHHHHTEDMTSGALIHDRNRHFDIFV